MKDFQLQVGEWATGIFKQNNKAITEHLRREVMELMESNDPEEGGDCLLILLHHAYVNGYDLLGEAKKKFAIVQTRKWGEPDEMGVIEHIRSK